MLEYRHGGSVRYLRGLPKILTRYLLSGEIAGPKNGGIKMIDSALIGVLGWLGIARPFYVTCR